MVIYDNIWQFSVVSLRIVLTKNCQTLPCRPFCTFCLLKSTRSKNTILLYQILICSHLLTSRPTDTAEKSFPLLSLGGSVVSMTVKISFILGVMIQSLLIVIREGAEKCVKTCVCIRQIKKSFCPFERFLRKSLILGCLPHYVGSLKVDCTECHLDSFVIRDKENKESDEFS